MAPARRVSILVRALSRRKGRRHFNVNCNRSVKLCKKFLLHSRQFQVKKASRDKRFGCATRSLAKRPGHLARAAFGILVMQLSALSADPNPFVTESDPLLQTRGPAGFAGGAGASAEFLRQIEMEIPFLRRTVRRWHRDAADADDLVQDTLVQAIANSHLWQPGSDLRAWLFTIMRNRFLSGTARSARAALAVESIAEVDPGRPATAELRLILRDLSAALRRLPSNQRSAVLLIGVEGKSYDEAATSMGTSIGAVRSHVMRGRDRLRAMLRGSDARTPFALKRTSNLPEPAPLAAE